jgi:lysine-ketoglutarate reductase/saccharopine dehydrogenase-like protein (TIGR00300 family)
MAALIIERHVANVPAPSAIVTAEGHLIDSALLTGIFDAVIERRGAFEVLAFDIGRTNDEFSRLTLKVSAPDAAALAALVEALIPLGCHAAAVQDALVRVADRDGCAPEDFYSTTNQRTSARLGGAWLPVEKQRMDAAIVVADGRASCRKLRDLEAGDRVVCGLDGIRVTPEFRDRERADFGFMANDVSSERRVEVSAARIARMMRETKAANGRIVFVAGPVLIHTGGAEYFARLVRAGFVDVLLAGNALAVHDAEQALFGTSLGVDLEAGAPVSGGHRHHMRAINAINRAGGIGPAVAAGVLKTGVMAECVRANVH